MAQEVIQHIPPDVFKILLVLALAFILGLEREEKKLRGPHYFFGGIVTFPLIGLIGYGAAVLSSQNTIPLAVGLAVVGGFLLISYRHKISTSEHSGFSNEISGIVTYLQGALVFFEHYWIATTLVVITLLFLELKKGLETFITKMPSGEIFTFARFLFLTAVILPVVPDQEYTAFKLNPYKIWLVVVGVSSLSYLSYLLQRFLKERGGTLMSAMIGGTYSSTAVTVALSKKASRAKRPHLYSGSIIIACGVMFLRILILLAIFNKALMRQVLFPFIILTAASCIGGYIWAHIPDPPGQETSSKPQLKNPLEIYTAFLFAIIFTIVLILTYVTVEFLGVGGIYYLAGLVGGLDVDPFVMGLTQTAGATLPFQAAAIAVFVAASSNNFIKGVYALIFSDRKTGIQTATGLFLLTLAGLAPILFIK
ncbi:MAG: DUF4010 domain-containing protein [bacterium]|nr:DUF4010 domain-containing protein [bacterium]